MIPFWVWILVAVLLWFIVPRIIAQKIGYSSGPLTLLGGPISILILLLLPDRNLQMFGATQLRARRKLGRSIGIGLILIALGGACVAIQLLIPEPLMHQKEPAKAFWLDCARTSPTDVVFALGLVLAFWHRKRCPMASTIAAVALLYMLVDHIVIKALVAWWNSITASHDLEDRIYVVRMESTIHIVTAVSYVIWTVAFGMLILAVFIGRSQWSPRRVSLDVRVPQLEIGDTEPRSQSKDTMTLQKPSI
jgi:hypothetical protein